MVSELIQVTQMSDFQKKFHTERYNRRHNTETKQQSLQSPKDDK